MMKYLTRKLSPKLVKQTSCKKFKTDAWNSFGKPNGESIKNLAKFADNQLSRKFVSTPEVILSAQNHNFVVFCGNCTQFFPFQCFSSEKGTAAYSR
jgi:hypothetical protein